MEQTPETTGSLPQGKKVGKKKGVKRTKVARPPMKKPKPRPGGPASMEKTFQALLVPFREIDHPELVVFVQNDTAARLAVGWKSFPVIWDVPDERPPIQRDEKDAVKPTQALWEWIWRGVPNTGRRGFFTKMATHCGVDESETKKTFDVLVSNRVIYPDNTLSEWAAKGIGHEVALRYKGSRRLT